MKLVAEQIINAFNAFCFAYGLLAVYQNIFHVYEDHGRLRSKKLKKCICVAGCAIWLPASS